MPTNTNNSDAYQYANLPVNQARRALILFMRADVQTLRTNNDGSEVAEQRPRTDLETEMIDELEEVLNGRGDDVHHGTLTFVWNMYLQIIRGQFQDFVAFAQAVPEIYHRYSERIQETVRTYTSRPTPPRRYTGQRNLDDVVAKDSDPGDVGSLFAR